MIVDFIRAGRVAGVPADRAALMFALVPVAAPVSGGSLTALVAQAAQVFTLAVLPAPSGVFVAINYL